MLCIKELNIRKLNQGLKKKVPATNTAWISNCWAATRSLKENNGWESVILVIDEIQKIANWSEVVKKEWDDDTFHDRNIKVLLLGSSRVLLEKGLSESLAGRFEEIRMSHWSIPRQPGIYSSL